MNELTHIPVLANEVLDGLNIHPDKTYIDGTLGGAGHSQLILEKLSPKGRLISFDQDIEAIKRAEVLQKKHPNWILVNQNFENINEYCIENKIKIDGGLLLDLGLSSIQLDNENRGFSFFSDASLDMRLNPDAELTATEVVNRYPEKTIADLIYQYGEERKSRAIAKAIVNKRPINSCQELAKIIEATYARSYQKSYFKTHPATKTFQALRIYINRELEVLENVLNIDEDVFELGARILVISFHSLEDRIVKNSFRNSTLLKVISKKPITANSEETKTNPRSRSAKLRIAEVIASVQ